MSRYMELTVDGTLEMVADRAFRAFRTIGRVEQHDPRTSVGGVIRVDGTPAEVTIAWVCAGERIKLDIAATSNDSLSQAADSAMYRFARAYKDVGWPGEFDDPPLLHSRGFQLAFGGILLTAMIVAGILLLR